jgi:hypothetical protein
MADSGAPGLSERFVRCPARRTAGAGARGTSITGAPYACSRSHRSQVICASIRASQGDACDGEKVVVPEDARAPWVSLLCRLCPRSVPKLDPGGLSRKIAIRGAHRVAPPSRRKRRPHKCEPTAQLLFIGSGRAPCAPVRRRNSETTTEEGRGPRMGRHIGGGGRRGRGSRIVRKAVAMLHAARR